MMYKLLNPNTEFQSLIIENQNGSVTSIPFDPDNTDYQAFKTDLANGVTLQDATGTAMTASDITTFLGTLK